MNIIRTERLILVPASAEFIERIIAVDRIGAGNLLGVIVTDEWPVDADAYAGLSFHLQAMREDEHELMWRIRLIVLPEAKIVIGSINLKGPPKTGDIEIGWGLIPSQRGQGHATEASRAVMDWAVSSGKVKRIVATIAEDNLASIRIAQRLGFTLTDERRRNLPMWVFYSKHLLNHAVGR